METSSADSLYCQHPLMIIKWTELMHKQAYLTFLDSQPANYQRLPEGLNLHLEQKSSCLQNPTNGFQTRKKELLMKLLIRVSCSDVSSFFGFFLYGVTTARKSSPQNLINIVSLPCSNYLHVFFHQIHPSSLSLFLLRVIAISIILFLT